MKPLITTIILLLLNACVLGAQNTSLIQVNYHIIVKSMAGIKETVIEMAKENDNAIPRLRQIEEQMDTHTAKSKDPDLSEDERFKHNAYALKARAEMLIYYRKIVVANQARFEAIDASIGKMKYAADAMNPDAPENRMHLKQTLCIVDLKQHDRCRPPGPRQNVFGGLSAGPRRSVKPRILPAASRRRIGF